jgi:chromate transport protein ChrA
LLALLTPGPILAALAALTGNATLRALTATLAAHALIAAPLLAIALLILAAATTSDGARGDEPTTPDAP